MEEKVNPFNQLVQNINNGMQQGAKQAAEAFKNAGEKVADSVEQAATAISDFKDDAAEFVQESKHAYEINKYQPVFFDDYISNSFEFPALVRVVEKNNAMNIDACKGAIGNIETVKGLRILNLYKNELDRINEKQIDGKLISFYPYFDEDFFHVHPFNKYSFLNLNDYFNHTKQERINELEKIAICLGAKHIKIRYMEESKSFTGSNLKANVDGGKGKGKDAEKAASEASHSSSDTSHYDFRLEKEVTLKGSNNPVRPELIYFQSESDILNLIESRLDPTNPILNKTCILSYGTSHGINESEAAKIDAAIASFKLKANATVKNEVQQENRMKLEYQIDF